MSDDEFEREWSRWQSRDLLISLCQDHQLAKLIYRINGPGSIDFLDTRPPVLNGKTPRSLLKDRKGRHRLRQALLKFPYI